VFTERNDSARIVDEENERQYCTRQLVRKETSSVLLKHNFKESVYDDDDEDEDEEAIR
jgi:hypothetical protein